MSRNRERMGLPTPTNTAAPPTQTHQENPGFSFVVPTEFVDLPSKGRYYPENHPLHNQETLEIKQMTAKEEDMLSSRALLKSGVAIDRVLQSLVMDKTIKVDSLLVGDRNALLIAARVSGYGEDYETSVNCPACGTNQKHVFNLLQLENTALDPDDSPSITDNGDGTFTTTLPRSAVTVDFRLLNGRDEKVLVDLAENNRKRKRADSLVTSQLKMLIVSANGETDANILAQVAESIPSIDARHLRNCYKEIAPNIDMTQYFECQECGHEAEMEVPLTAEFFWPDI